MTYRNISNDQGKNIFVNVVTGARATFNSKSSSINVRGVPADMTSYEVLLEIPKDITNPDCSPCGSVHVMNTIRIKGNFVKGDLAAEAAARTELLRLASAALADSLLDGFVPPITSTFAE